MAIDNNTLDKVLAILREEVIPAEGCTEPIALAFVAAKARQELGSIPEKIDVHVSGNIIKNVKSVVVPNSGGRVGIEVATALGALAGDAAKQLLVIQNVSKEDLQLVDSFLKEKRVNVYHETTDIKLYIRIEMQAGDTTVSVEVKHLHTNITQITKNNKVITRVPCNESDFNSPLTDRRVLSVRVIYDLAKEIDIELIKPLFKKVITLNSAIAEEGLHERYGVNLGSCIMKNIDEGIYGKDRKNLCASYAAAGSDARMSGCPMPVMTTSGSGNQGMTASLPLIKYAQLRNIEDDLLIRALCFSHLTTVHIKTNVGRLSAFCGAVCAAAAVSGALAFINNYDYEMVSNSVINTLGNLAGMICDGAKASCAMKIATGIYSAFDGVILSETQRVLHGGDGIIGRDVEQTIRNIGELACTGMRNTDDVILDIMLSQE